MADASRNRPAGSVRASTIFVILGLLIVPTGLGTVLFVYSAGGHAGAARSSYTQAHGARRAARVISEDTSADKNPTSAVIVRLNTPVNGRDTTTAHVQGAPAYAPGAPVTVVVDPQDPGYAELPGAPNTTNGQWELSLAIGVADILVLPFLVGLVALRQWHRHRRLLRRFLLR